MRNYLLKSVFFLSCLFFMVTCSREEIKIDSSKDSLPLELSELSDETAISLLQSYVKKFPDYDLQTRSSENIKIKSISRNYLSIPLTRSGRVNEQEDIPLLNFELEENQEEGFAVMIGDMRFPLLLAYSSVGNLNDTIFNVGLREWYRNIPNTILDLQNDYLDFQEKYKNITDLEGTTIPSQASVSGWFPGATLGEKVYVGSVVDVGWIGVFRLYNCYWQITAIKDKVENLTKTQWNQTSPYNQKLSSFPANCGKSGNIYAGCGPVAVAQILAHFNLPTKYDWTSLKSSPKISGTSVADATRRDQVSSLFSELYTVMKPTPSCDGTSVNTNDIKTALTYYGLKYDFTTYDVEYLSKTDFHKKKYPMIHYGKTDKGEGHFYVVDGFVFWKGGYGGSAYQWMPLGSTQFGEKINEECFLPFQFMGDYYSYGFRINWGWGGTSDGWYFTATGDKYNNSVYLYENIRK